MVGQTVNKRVHRVFIPVSININIIYQSGGVFKDSGREVDRTGEIKGG
jgi:hypothetical protein